MLLFKKNFCRRNLGLPNAAVLLADPRERRRREEGCTAMGYRKEQRGEQWKKREGKEGKTGRERNEKRVDGCARTLHL